MKKRLLLLALTSVMLMLQVNLFAQTGQDTTQYRIETDDGNEYIGKIIFEDEKIVRFQTDRIGEITIQVKHIKKRTAIEAGRLKDDKYWFENPQASRYFWVPNGYGINKGEAYYQNVWVMFNQGVYGVNDNFSVGGGVVPLFLFGGESTPTWLTTKFSIPLANEKVNLGAGTLTGAVLGESNAGFGILYGVSTFGTRDNNLSIGLGWGYVADNWTKTPIINISGMLRTSSRNYLITENYYIDLGDEYGALCLIGGRWIIKKAGLDYGFMIPIFEGQEQFVAIPWLGITVPIGK